MPFDGVPQSSAVDEASAGGQWLERTGPNGRREPTVTMFYCALFSDYLRLNPFTRARAHERGLGRARETLISGAPGAFGPQSLDSARASILGNPHQLRRVGRSRVNLAPLPALTYKSRWDFRPPI